MTNRFRHLKHLALAVSAVALVVAGPLPTNSTTASLPQLPGTTASVRAESPAASQVDAFFGAYRRASLGGVQETPEEVRHMYLDPELDVQLTDWAAEHDTDPVFRAQNIPDSWSVAALPGHEDTETVALTEHWGNSATTSVWYTLRLADLVIVGLTDPPL
ncbi:hypothetical protein [Streptomyces sp. NPDC051994]|uniref:hypothetical protein n=1 Tax=unclassified Streptomyces TaxID=2593676 RepID=UPI003427B0BE